MPLFFNKKLNEEIHFMVWKLTESIEELETLVSPDSEDYTNLNLIGVDSKRKEYLAGKNAIMQMCRLVNVEFKGIIKDEHGKPYLKDNTIEMSLTHTTEFIGVVFSKRLSVGIDIEKPRTQIFKVIGRLCVESEIEWMNDDLEKATILWSAKEALYKLYGKRKVDFKENLFLKEINGTLLGEIKMPDHKAEHKIFIEKLPNHLLVLAY
jgi:4'-phosphopantetheinyl transferase